MKRSLFIIFAVAVFAIAPTFFTQPTATPNRIEINDYYTKDINELLSKPEIREKIKQGLFRSTTNADDYGPAIMQCNEIVCDGSSVYVLHCTSSGGNFCPTGWSWYDDMWVWNSQGNCQEVTRLYQCPFAY